MNKSAVRTGRYINTSKAAKWLGRTEQAVTGMCRDGRLEAYHGGYGEKWLILLRSVEELLPYPVDETLLDEL